MARLNAVSALVVPVMLCFTAIYGLYRGVDIYDCLIAGAKRGLHVMADILPALIVLLPAVYMFRESGAADMLARLLSPVFGALGIPPETAPLVLLRPISGSGANAVAGEIMASHGADSLIGRTAAIMLGSTETTFYVTAVYFSAAGVKKARYAVPAALIADLAGFIAASFAARLFFS
ncbi:MAG: spore maturation protein [Oscillospiraceae bacterium]|nr:spore maturation protein [Oscillospiraceae bacterium]